MQTNSPSAATRADFGLLVLRATLAGLLLFHGVDKATHGVGEVADDLVRRGLPRALSYGVFLGELAAPLLILAGVFTRPAAVVAGGSILFATLLVHADAYVRIAPTGAWAAESFAFYVLCSAAVALLGAGRIALRRGAGRWD